MHFITIETDRMLLKGLSPEDMDHIFRNLPKSEIKEVLGHRTEEDYLKEEHKHKKGYSSYNRSFRLFLITDKSSGKIIGRCGLHNWNAEHERAEIGYVMEDEMFKRKGYMTEAVAAIIDYGFNDMELNRIEALVGIGNVPSLRIMEKFHFQKEGILKQHTAVAGGFEDSVLFSRLYQDYKGNQLK